jgi:hypothetical protein
MVTTTVAGLGTEPVMAPSASTATVKLAMAKAVVAATVHRTAWERATAMVTAALHDLWAFARPMLGMRPNGHGDGIGLEYGNGIGGGRGNGHGGNSLNGDGSGDGPLRGFGEGIGYGAGQD